MPIICIVLSLLPDTIPILNFSTKLNELNVIVMKEIEKIERTRPTDQQTENYYKMKPGSKYATQGWDLMGSHIE